MQWAKLTRKNCFLCTLVRNSQINALQMAVKNINNARLGCTVQWSSTFLPHCEKMFVCLGMLCIPSPQLVGSRVGIEFFGMSAKANWQLVVSNKECLQVVLSGAISLPQSYLFIFDRSAHVTMEFTRGFGTSSTKELETRKRQIHTYVHTLLMQLTLNYKTSELD